jgi:GNAT superfamily N-acetyltransferase
MAKRTRPATLPAQSRPPPSNGHQLFTQNLSLFAKLFLDNKSVFFDVASFNYYILVQGACPGPRAHSTYVGFFSKEKMSWDNNNLACILVFPPWQRQGLGKILMGASYELSRREGRVGGPEKPLSELGRRGYLRFWQARVARELLDFKGKGTVTVEELAARCWMLAEDVMVALKEMGILEVRKKSDVVGVCKSGVREWVGAKHVDMAPPVDRGCFLEEWATEGENEEN